MLAVAFRVVTNPRITYLVYVLRVQMTSDQLPLRAGPPPSRRHAGNRTIVPGGYVSRRFLGDSHVRIPPTSNAFRTLLYCVVL